MIKNKMVEDVKPENIVVQDVLPKNLLVDNINDRLYEQVLSAGMYMGIPPHTYPTAGTVQSPFSP